jgi:hypothetical protein
VLENLQPCAGCGFRCRAARSSAKRNLFSQKSGNRKRKSKEKKKNAKSREQIAEAKTTQSFSFYLEPVDKSARSQKAVALNDCREKHASPAAQLPDRDRSLRVLGKT